MGANQTVMRSTLSDTCLSIRWLIHTTKVPDYLTREPLPISCVVQSAEDKNTREIMMC